MYAWGDFMEDWARPGAYRFDSARRAERERDAALAAASGPRTYAVRGPDEDLIDPRKRAASQSSNPLIVATDVTGSMRDWPAEIFDRLPLFYQTLSQYRPDLEICFAAIGDAYCDHWPLQVTDFARGFALETRLKALYGEGGGGDEPESYGLFAWWVDHHVTVSAAEKPFLIVFGDATMHSRVPAAQVRGLLGDEVEQDADSVATWKRVARRWNVWFLRRAGRPGDRIDRQWGRAVGSQHILHIHDEQRAVDYAMGLIARHWGYFDDFRANMSARQPESRVAELEGRLRALPTRPMSLPA
ncbi:MAG TPA: hypothetical protein VNO81_03240 [Candidatus Nitrosotenuis sp.]|jgi:hypothetical protein|nr:hypothetical protein [Candidatus Nitrosotenuis sp.]